MKQKTYYTVYQIKNTINGKCYIGKHKTKDLDDRILWLTELISK